MKAAPATAAEAGLADIVRLIASYRAARALTAAVSLGVFDALSRESLDARGVAERVSADPRATEILLDALAALGFLAKSGGIYANSEVARRHLVRGSAGGLAENLRYQELLAPAWAGLPEAVREGRPPRSLEELMSADAAFQDEYALAMADISVVPARELASRLDLNGVAAALDVGGGPGVYAEALASQAPGLKVVLLDLPPTLKAASKRLSASPSKDRIELRPGDYHRADFGREAFDLVLFSHVTHNEGERANRALLRKAYEALRSGGRVVVHDFTVSEERTRPVFGALFSLHMLVYTKAGRTYSAGEYESWLEAAGFKDPRRFDICPGAENGSTAIVAVKP